MPVVSIVAADNAVYVDNLAIWPIDLSDLDPTIWAIQWDGARGEIEYRMDPDTFEKRPNFVIVDFTPYQKYIDRHETARVELVAQAQAQQAQLESEIAALKAPAHVIAG